METSESDRLLGGITVCDAEPAEVRDYLSSLECIDLLTVEQERSMEDAVRVGRKAKARLDEEPTAASRPELEQQIEAGEEAMQMDIRTVFSNRHIVLPVIHVDSEDQALRNVAIARAANADGVFLINHEMSSSDLLSIHRAVFAEHSDWWIGVNCLDLTPLEVFQTIDDTVMGVWVDNAMIDEGADEQPDAEQIFDMREKTGWSGLYFGGVAFKYQRPVDDLALAAVPAR